MIDGRDLNWICDQVGIGRETRLRRVLYLRFAEGYTCAAIAAEVGSKINTVYAQIHQGKKRIGDHQWRMKLSQEIAEAIDVIRQAVADDPAILAAGITLTEEARAFIDSMRAPNLKEIMPALYDELGRRVGAAATVITIDDVRRVLRQGTGRRADQFIFTRPTTAREKAQIKEKSQIFDTSHKG
jgi:predicted DNA-binding protein YlxM (UPF0122 family)